VVNYPNPFSTSTRFYYELTGSQLPEVFQIHIYTVTGRLVKVIDLKALGEVRIGRHLTAYAWDGRDDYGDRLANGVYLYRVILRMPGDAELKRREDGLESYFRSGWGKMVLMR
jgi:flagellar hook assembly protein FlgD